MLWERVLARALALAMAFVKLWEVMKPRLAKIINPCVPAVVSYGSPFFPAAWAPLKCATLRETIMRVDGARPLPRPFAGQEVFCWEQGFAIEA